MREIKFRAWDKDTCEMSSPESIQTLLVKNPLTGEQVSDLVLMQYTGYKDINDKEIYFGDLLNICFSSSAGEYVHDCVYEAQQGRLGDLQFRLHELLWQSGGYNQYPISNHLCLEHKSLNDIYSEEKKRMVLIITDYYPKTEHRFNRYENCPVGWSQYFEVIGNIHENPELLEK